MVGEGQLQAWKNLLDDLGYVWGHQTPSFVQYAEPPGTDQFPIDLMVVNDATFAKLVANAESKEFGATQVKVPRPLDLIALKLHALRSAERAADGKDFQDVMALVRLGNFDLSDPEFAAMLERYANKKTSDELRRRLS